MDFANRIVLVTGGAGFIGSHIVDQLIAQKAEKVIALDDFSAGFRSFISPEYDNVTIIKGDITDQSSLDEIFDSVDIVIHAAIVLIHDRSFLVGTLPPFVQIADVGHIAVLLDPELGHAAVEEEGKEQNKHAERDSAECTYSRHTITPFSIPRIYGENDEDISYYADGGQISKLPG